MFKIDEGGKGGNFNVGEAILAIDNKVINLKPYYQRNLVVKPDWQDSLIRDILADSSHYMARILLRYNEQTEQYEVIDGQQRITTLYEAGKIISKLLPYQINFDLITGITDEEALAIFNYLQESNPLTKAEKAKNSASAEVQLFLQDMENTAIWEYCQKSNTRFERREIITQCIMLLEETAKIDLGRNSITAYTPSITVEQLQELKELTEWLNIPQKFSWLKKSAMPVIFRLARIAKENRNNTQFIGFLDAFLAGKGIQKAVFPEYRKDYQDNCSSATSKPSQVLARYEAIEKAFNHTKASEYDYKSKEKVTAQKVTIDELKQENEKLEARLRYLEEEKKGFPSPQITSSAPSEADLLFNEKMQKLEAKRLQEAEEAKRLQEAKKAEGKKEKGKKEKVKK